MSAISQAFAQGLNTRSIMVGDVKVTAILESRVEAPPGLMTGLSDEQFRRRRDENLQGSASSISINCFLIEVGSSRFLVDTGLGDEETLSDGRLETELRRLGLKPGGISHVLFTHLHADHFGGAISEFGKRWFSNSEFIAHQAERDYLFGDTAPTGNSMVIEQYKLAQNLRAILPQFNWVREGPTLPGIELVHLPGHTPGHSGFRVRSRHETLLLWGDIVHQPYLQFPDPSVGVAFDVDPLLAVETRLKTLKRMAARKELIAGTHTHFPTFGRVEPQASGFAFVPMIEASAVERTSPI